MSARKKFNSVDVLILICALTIVAAVIFRTQIVGFFTSVEDMSEYTVTFESDAVENGVAQALRKGQAVYWDEKGMQLGGVSDLTVSAAPIYAVGDDGAMVETSSTSLSVIRGTFNVTATTKSGCYVNGTEFLGGGMKMTIRTQTAVFSATVISVEIRQDSADLP